MQHWSTGNASGCQSQWKPQIAHMRIFLPNDAQMQCRALWVFMMAFYHTAVDPIQSQKGRLAAWPYPTDALQTCKALGEMLCLQPDAPIFPDQFSMHGATTSRIARASLWCCYMLCRGARSERGQGSNYQSSGSPWAASCKQGGCSCECDTKLEDSQGICD